MSDNKLPPNWVSQFSKTQNLPYFFNKITGEKSWKRPTSSSHAAVSNTATTSNNQQPGGKTKKTGSFALNKLNINSFVIKKTPAQDRLKHIQQELIKKQLQGGAKTSKPAKPVIGKSIGSAASKATKTGNMGMQTADAAAAKFVGAPSRKHQIIPAVARAVKATCLDTTLTPTSVAVTKPISASAPKPAPATKPAPAMKPPVKSNRWNSSTEPSAAEHIKRSRWDTTPRPVKTGTPATTEACTLKPVNVGTDKPMDFATVTPAVTKCLNTNSSFASAEHDNTAPLSFLTPKIDVSNVSVQEENCLPNICGSRHPLDSHIEHGTKRKVNIHPLTETFQVDGCVEPNKKSRFQSDTKATKMDSVMSSQVLSPPQNYTVSTATSHVAMSSLVANESKPPAETPLPQPKIAPFSYASSISPNQGSTLGMPSPKPASFNFPEPTAAMDFKFNAAQNLETPSFFAGICAGLKSFTRFWDVATKTPAKPTFANRAPMKRYHNAAVSAKRVLNSSQSELSTIQQRLNLNQKVIGISPSIAVIPQPIVAISQQKQKITGISPTNTPMSKPNYDISPVSGDRYNLFDEDIVMTDDDDMTSDSNESMEWENDVPIELAKPLTGTSVESANVSVETTPFSVQVDPMKIQAAVAATPTKVISRSPLPLPSCIPPAVKPSVVEPPTVIPPAVIPPTIIPSVVIPSAVIPSTVIPPAVKSQAVIPPAVKSQAVIPPAVKSQAAIPPIIVNTPEPPKPMPIVHKPVDPSIAVRRILKAKRNAAGGLSAVAKRLLMHNETEPRPIPDKVPIRQISSPQVKPSIRPMTSPIPQIGTPPTKKCTVSKLIIQPGEIICVVIDTNVFLESLSYVKNFIAQSDKLTGRPTIRVPYQVLQELDHIKDGAKKGASIKAYAMASIKYMEKYLQNSDKRLQAQSVQDHQRNLIGIDSPDDHILNCCLQCQADEQFKQVVLLSNDINLRNKALCSKVAAYSMAQLTDALGIK